MAKRIYLVGAITRNPETHEWRKIAAKLLGDKFEIDDPTVTKFDKEALKAGLKDEAKWQQMVAEQEAEILLPKSYQCVEKADIILVNLQLEPEDRPMVGSIMELAWAYAMHKTVIAIKGKGFYSKHPMLRKVVHAWADDLEEACDIIKMFFDRRR